MTRPIPLMFAAALIAAPGAAQACTSMNEAMAHFNTVKDAYVAAAPGLKPEQFAVWTGHLKSFGDAMGKQNFAGACSALDQASVELGFTEAAAPAAPATPEPPKPPEPTTAEVAKDIPKAEPEKVEPAAPATPAITPVADAGGWVECPRGRCRGGDRY